MPMANSGGVSNRGVPEEPFVVRADGTVDEVTYPDPERVPEPEEEPEPERDEAPDLPKDTPHKRTPRKSAAK